MDRLRAQDLMLVWPEEKGWPQDIGALAILEEGALLDSDGRFRIEVARQRILSRLHLVPRFRQLLDRPGFGMGWPYWTDATAFHIEDHVGVVPVPAPGDETQLLSVCERLRRVGLERSRPLWQMWFLTGLAGRRIGLLMMLHHAIADGVAGVAALGAFVDVSPDVALTEPPQWKPARAPSRREVLEDNVRRKLDGFDHALSTLYEPVRPMRKLRHYWPTVHESFFEGRAPRTSFNHRIGSDRRLAVIRGNLAAACEVGHAHGAKVNDVLLSAVTGGYRELMTKRGEVVDGATLRAFVPVSLHRSGAAEGNLDGAMVVPLPVGEADPVRRLRQIAAETAVRKKKARPQAGSIFRNALMQRAFLALMPHQHFMNAYVANVPGPAAPLYFAGSQILELFPLVPITANLAIGVGALSYAGQFNLTVVADRDLVPDIDVFAAGTRTALRTLTAGALAAAE